MIRIFVSYDLRFLILDPSIQIYSVRTKTGDCRGFVQLPIVQDMEGNPAVVEVGIVCSAAKCYVETCSRSRNEALEPCFHIRSSVESIGNFTCSMSTTGYCNAFCWV